MPGYRSLVVVMVDSERMGKDIIALIDLPSIKFTM